MTRRDLLFMAGWIIVLGWLAFALATMVML